MLTEKQVKEIREHLEKAQNPLFLFDNDQDGLCSFLLLQRCIGRGKGFPVKGFLTEDYIRRVTELKADYLFILDKPVVEKEFWDEMEKINIPVVWIDHHGIQGIVKTPEFVNYYDPVLNEPSTNEPVTALCYQIAQKKEDIWVAVAGCVADAYMPDFYEEFKEKYPDLSIDSDKPFDVFYKSEIGKLARIIGNGLKDKTTNVITMLKFLMGAETPYDVLNESSKNRKMHKRSKEIEEKYNHMLDKAKILSKEKGNVLFFKYSGDTSIGGELANGMQYEFPNKVIVIARIKPLEVSLSLRGQKIRDKYKKIIDSIDGAIGGGHENAVGGKFPVEKLGEFEKKIREAFD